MMINGKVAIVSNGKYLFAGSNDYTIPQTFNLYLIGPKIVNIINIPSGGSGGDDSDDDEEKAISFGHYYLTIGLVSLVFVIVLNLKKLELKKTNRL